MNATERARRSDSLYYDTQVTNRRALCDMIANLESDLTESKAENAKLRKLLRDMFRDFANADCELKARHGRTFMAVTRYEPRLREIGVLVDK